MQLVSNTFSIPSKDSDSNHNSQLVATRSAGVDRGPDIVLKGRYRIERELGRGGFGVVFLASDLLLHGRQVVIKAPVLPSPQEPRALKKFQDEVEALARIQHPGVVAVLDSGETSSGHPFFVMEYVPGKPLTEWMREGGAPLAEVADFIRQCGAALAAAHALGICHRDLKPENILVQENGNGLQIKLIDFGIASISAPPQGRLTQIVGTLSYMAPEQLDGRPITRSDIYALGVLAYQLLTGRVPYDSESPLELYSMQGAGKYRPASALREELPEQVDDLIARALEFHPDQRFSSVADFSRTLSDVLTSTQRASLGLIQPHLAAGLGPVLERMADQFRQATGVQPLMLVVHPGFEPPSIRSAAQEQPAVWGYRAPMRKSNVQVTIRMTERAKMTAVCLASCLAGVICGCTAFVLRHASSF